MERVHASVAETSSTVEDQPAGAAKVASTVEFFFATLAETSSTLADRFAGATESASNGEFASAGGDDFASTVEGIHPVTTKTSSMLDGNSVAGTWIPASLSLGAVGNVLTAETHSMNGAVCTEHRH